MTKLPGRPAIPATTTCDEDGSPTLAANDNDPERVFYVYAWLRPCGTPFYIGKGKGHRYTMTARRNVIFDRIVAKIERSGRKPEVVIAHKFLTESEAFAIEMTEIARHGRINLRTGTLANLTDGGEGLSGAVFSQAHRDKIGAAHKGMVRTKETRDRIAAAAVGRVVSDADRERRRAVMLRPEIREKLIAINTGKSPSKETRAKMSASQSGRVHKAETKEKIGRASRNAPPKSGYKGVNFHKRVGKWAARLRPAGGSIDLGYYSTETEAAIAYDVEARKLWGLDCHLNFPDMEFAEPPARAVKSYTYQKPPRSGKLKGATLDKRIGRWFARLNADGRTKHLGMYATEQEAARAYDQAAVEEYGVGNCYLNFPEEYQ